MRLRSRWALVGVLGLASCAPDGTGPEDLASLALVIAFAADGQMAPDAGIVHVQGPANRTVSIQPGQTVTVDGLPPGNYTVSLEGLRAGQLESFGETTVTVVAGENRQANITLQSFIPAFVNAPPEVHAGTPFTVQFGGVQGAASYVVEYSTDPGFGQAQSVTANGTSVSITLQTPGTYLFRARARNRFNTLSHASPPSTGTEIRTPVSPPVVTSYDVELRPGAPCGLGFRDLETLEIVVYEDADADFPTGSPLAESAAQAAVESAYRFEGETDWTRFFAAKAWNHQDGATGAAGTLRSGACWRLPDTDPTFMDHRVRLRDADGNWGEYVATRVMLPESITLDPADQVTIAIGGAQQYTAVVRDADNAIIPPDVVSWSSANRPPMGSITEDGRYALAAGAAGVDVVYAWAGRARRTAFIQGPEAGSPDSWWAPCWNLNDFGLTQGVYLYYRMIVYAGVQYRFTLQAAQGATPTGNPDLYIRLGTRPTAASHDAGSTSGGHAESITWIAPSTGLLWIGVYAYSAFAGVTFSSSTTDGLCGFPGSALLATEPPPTDGGAAPSPLPVTLTGPASVSFQSPSQGLVDTAATPISPLPAATRGGTSAPPQRSRFTRINRMK